jgi:hypothetical protein
MPDQDEPERNWKPDWIDRLARGRENTEEVCMYDFLDYSFCEKTKKLEAAARRGAISFYNDLHLEISNPGHIELQMSPNGDTMITISLIATIKDLIESECFDDEQLSAIAKGLADAVKFLQDYLALPIAE